MKSDTPGPSGGQVGGAGSCRAGVRTGRTAGSGGNGELVEYTLSWEEGGVPHVAHHLHVLTVDPATDRITQDRVFCGGRWPAELIARMGDVARGR